DCDGEEYEHVEYTPYGETWIDEGRDTLERINYLFTSKELDTETGLYYFGARYLDPQTSRWINPDPIMDGLNWYCFCSNNPIKYKDPNGKELVLHKYLSDTEKAEILALYQQMTDYPLKIEDDKIVYAVEGHVPISIEKPKGNELVKRLITSDKTCKVEKSYDKDTSKADSGYDATNGKGSDMTVYINLKDNAKVPTADKETGKISDEESPAVIRLAHESIHAERGMRGVGISYDDAESFILYPEVGAGSEKTPQLNTWKRAVPKEELYTIELQGYRNDITENDIRKEQNMNKRVRYYEGPYYWPKDID
ncbi:MAG: RHS repeat-associated core domain-containing protein, partial [Spirochaetia bacterium]